MKNGSFRIDTIPLLCRGQTTGAKWGRQKVTKGGNKLVATCRILSLTKTGILPLFAAIRCAQINANLDASQKSAASAAASR